MPRRAWGLAAVLAAAAVAVAAAADRGRGGDPVEVTGFSMGTYVHVVAEGPGAQEAAAGVLPELDRMTRALDRFDPGSDVARLNARAGEGPVTVGSETTRLIGEALRLARLSDGAFDPTIGPLVDLWGFVDPEAVEENEDAQGTVRGRHLPDVPAIEAARARVGYRWLQLAEDGQAASLDRAGMVLDLGGIAKGWAVDRLAERFRGAGVTRALIDLGGNLYALGGRPDGSPWRVGIQHPRRPGAVIAVVEATDEALATSGDYERYFIDGGTRYSHLLDPATGYPARELASVTVLAPHGVDADGLSTAVFVLGPERGARLVESLPGVEAVFVDTEMKVTYTSGLRGRIQVMDP
ncbi:FAD:protein FMN transferase [Limnochorda pilosa]|uniref:FAD:protein FMN transferase n=1 Tax=Limnochorda pilosa TaxID=1555112 RepID=A0A0K2SQ70_LIMPI|nr:FAD:protein FMN transferase [Limnochorda pilosa]BAS29241.1 thiamine biosynthesis protein ApbE [Limnochorda pilosa]